MSKPKSQFQAENQKIIQSLKGTSENVIEQFSQSYVQIGRNSGVNIQNDSNAFFDAVEKLDKNVPATDFCHAMQESLNSINSSALKQSLTQELNATIAQKEAQHLAQIQSDRQANIQQREDFAVTGITSISYCVYLNILSAFGSYIPVVRDVAVSVPSSYLYLGVIGIVASQLTAPYESPGEAFEHAKEISNRVFTNSGLRLCYTALSRVVEHAAVASANAVNDHLEGRGAPTSP